eukprot:Phypoly_transcript_14617.p2 GENE.Phypoly_transcript_14617~~Phypoly_transcript_14617.p2  ORF type:complete len:132 (+),score=18.00 Phypoly_transcript_14617:388-783(+)
MSWEEEECLFPVLSKHGTASGWEIRCSNREISFLITPLPFNGHAELSYPRPSRANIWMHIAGTFDGSNMCLYLDGMLVASKEFETKTCEMADCQQPFTIGFCPEWPDRYNFVGEIKEARICNKALKPVQFL